tara:strand:- start:1517 stop:2266 length:750 start_codon:yes stop_codon:yes gene_type:complete
MLVIQTDHFVNIRVTDCFAYGTKSKLVKISNYKPSSNDTLASYGILRGVGSLLKQSKNFYYLDHGYLGASSRSFKEGGTIIDNLDGYFRIVKNDFIGFDLKQFDSKRLDKLKLNFAPTRKSGEYIILSEPSNFIKEFYNIPNWVDDTINKIKNFTDRKIFVHNKFSKIPLDLLLEKAWAFVSFQSTAGFKSMLRGVPSHFTHNKLKDINSIENIENGIINEDVFKSLSYNQWTLEEIKNGVFLDYFNIN